VSLKDQLLIFPKKVGLHVKTRLSDDTDLREVRIIPKETGYIVEVVFVKVLNQLVLDKRRVVGIDLGLVNLVTMINNIGLKPIIIKGGAVKSINQYYNKEQAKLSRIDDQQNNREKYGTKMLRLTNRRNRMIHDRFHKISRKIVNYCVENNIGTIVIGYNEGWKREIALRKNTNQNFVTIPFHKLLHKIKYKAEEIGLTILKVDESYTSKYSFLDNEPIKKLPFYQGKRINSSMYCASGGTIIHADVNGAYNILKKALPKAISANGIEAVGLQPTRWRLAAVTG
jgi:putative transposase